VKTQKSQSSTVFSPLETEERLGRLRRQINDLKSLRHQVRVAIQDAKAYERILLTILDAERDLADHK